MRRAGAALGLLALLLGAGCSGQPDAPDAIEPDSEQTEGAPGRRSPIRPRSRGSRTRELRALLQSVSETIRLADRPPPSLIRLRRRAEDDRPRLQQALRSRGYYDARDRGRGRSRARAGRR